jgi:hypothetical protein
VTGRPTLLTPETNRAIVAAIRAGAYDWIAAQANGVDRNTFMAWMRRGEREQTEPFLSFRNDVLTARAQARLSAEIEVRKDQPFNWLRFGPGRERDDAPGWTESKEIRHSGSLAVVQSEEWLRIAAALEGALCPFPEARIAVANALQELQTAEAATVVAPLRGLTPATGADEAETFARADEGSDFEPNVAPEVPRDGDDR